MSWEWLTDADWKTWIGHAVQGVLIVLLGVLLGFDGRSMVATTAAIFAHRELDNGWEAWRAGTLKDRKVVDGFMDWLAPVLAAIITASLIGG